MTTYSYFVIFGILQIIHSQEEIWTGFHEKWFVFSMPRWLFLTFEFVLSATIITYTFKPQLNGADHFMQWFIFAMLLNGIEHIVWAAVKKTYVPGLVTAPFFVLLFAAYYKQLIY
jgi:hypothetical protein